MSEFARVGKRETYESIWVGGGCEVELICARACDGVCVMATFGIGWTGCWCFFFQNDIRLDLGGGGAGGSGGREEKCFG
jgi:hypothetical protein